MRPRRRGWGVIVASKRGLRLKLARQSANSVITVFPKIGIVILTVQAIRVFFLCVESFLLAARCQMKQKKLSTDKESVDGKRKKATFS